VIKTKFGSKGKNRITYLELVQAFPIAAFGRNPLELQSTRQIDAFAKMLRPAPTELVSMGS
jgi:hypothetical protein